MDSITEKKCGKCKTIKALSEFTPSKMHKHGRHSQCRICRHGVGKEWEKNNKERLDKYLKGYYEANGQKIDLNRRYGISVKDYEGKLLEQNGVCAICKSPPKYGKRLSVDHDHKSGKVRGLLCLSCNTGLGQFKDNIDLLEEAISYLNEYKE